MTLTLAYGHKWPLLGLTLRNDPMSFSFNWPHFSDQFHHDAIQMLNNALNKGNKPPVIADKIEVVELHMGTQVRITCIVPGVLLIPPIVLSHPSWKSEISVTLLWTIFVEYFV